MVGAGAYLALEKSRVLPYSGNNQVGRLSRVFGRVCCFVMLSGSVFVFCFPFSLSSSAASFRLKSKVDRVNNFVVLLLY